MEWYKFILKIKPDGKAFRSILYTKTFFEVVADFFESIIDYAIFTINDQVWFVNDNFDPEPWERRYQVTPSEFATLAQRRAYIKTLMLFPQTQNRLSKDYMSDVLLESGYENITLSYNPTGTQSGFLHANDFGDELGVFSVGSLTYNSFIVSGVVTAAYYSSIILLLMSLKPLQVVLYDELEVDTTIALTDDLAWALSDSLATVLTKL
jgi:hypothetical protein